MTCARRACGAPRGPRQRDSRKDCILDAAETIIAAQGSRSLTIDNVVEVSGFAKGTIYHYFKSRDHILDDLIVRSSASSVLTAEREIDARPIGDWIGSVRLWVSVMTSQYAQKLELYRCRSAKTLGDFPIVTSLARLLERGNAACAWQVDEPKSAAIFLFSGMQGLIEECELWGSESDRVTRDIACLFESFLR